MKKATILLTLLGFIFTATKAQLLEENFSFSGALTANGWSQVLTTATNPVTAGTAGLTYSGYGGSNIGNAALMTTSGQDVQKGGWTALGSGNLFLSAMINISSASTATGDYFLGFYSNGAARARLFAKTVTGGFNIGISKGTNTAVYSSTVYSQDVTHLIVLKYSFITGTTLDDSVSLFVDPVVNGVENNLVISNMNDGGTDLSTSFAQTVIIRQGTAAQAPALTIDGIRVGTSWAEILSPPNTSFYYNGTGPLNATSSWGTAANGTGTAPSNFTTGYQSFYIANTSNAILSGSWTVSGASSKIIVPALDTLKAIGGATINASTIDINATGAYLTDNVIFPTWGSVAGSILLDNASGFSVSPGTFNTITIPSFTAGGDFIVLNGDVNMNDNALTVAGKLQINGSNKIYGSDQFTLSSTGTLRIAHPLGITANPATLTGAIQMAFGRSFDPAASYTYLGTGTNLETGNGLPSNVTGTVTIKLLNTTDIISLTQSIVGNPGGSSYPTISLTKGLLRLGNNSITLNSMINGYSGSYVITDGTGTLSRPVLSTGGSSSNTKNFYVGTASEYRLLSITFPLTIGTPPSTILTIGYKNTDPGSNGYPSGILAHSYTGYWTLAMSVAPTNTFTLEVETNGMAGGPGTNLLKRITGANAAWELNGGTATITGTLLKETLVPAPASAPISMDIAIGVNSLLPVKLLSFSGVKQTEGVQLKWQVTEESSIDKYEIEKSSDAVKFEFIGSLNASNTSYAKTYSWLDKTANAPVNFYRLKIVNQDGSVKYSSILKFEFNGAKRISVYPNPVIDGRLNLSMYGQPAGNYALSLTDASGRNVMAGNLAHSGSNTVRTIVLNNNLQSGVHYLVITGPSNERETIKVYIIH